MSAFCLLPSAFRFCLLPSAFCLKICQLNSNTNRSLRESRHCYRALRLRIRSYVWTEGLAAIVVTLGIAFWLSLAFDWLFEPPWQVRAAMLVMTGVAVLVVANRLIFSRVFRPIDDTNLAVVLERRFRDYHDSLLTTVELNTQSARQAGFNQQMLDDTRRQAVERSQQVRLNDVFRMAPLLRTLIGAAALSVSVLVFAVTAREAFATWLDRVVLLNRDSALAAGQSCARARLPCQSHVENGQGVRF